MKKVKKVNEKGELVFSKKAPRKAERISDLFGLHNTSPMYFPKHKKKKNKSIYGLR